MREFKIGQYVFYRHHKAEGRFVVIRLLSRPKREPPVEASELTNFPGGR